MQEFSSGLNEAKTLFSNMIEIDKDAPRIIFAAMMDTDFHISSSKRGLKL